MKDSLGFVILVTQQRLLIRKWLGLAALFAIGCSGETGTPPGTDGANGSELQGQPGSVGTSTLPGSDDSALAAGGSTNAIVGAAAGATSSTTGDSTTAMGGPPTNASGGATLGPGVAGSASLGGAGGVMAAAGTAGATLDGALGGAGLGGAGSGGAGGTEPVGAPLGALALAAVPANGTVGLEWPAIEGATSYNLYWSTEPGVSVGAATPITGAERGYIHRQLTNGTTYYYVVTAVTVDGESAPSAEVSAVPTGEWVLEQFGTGDFEDFTTEQRVSIPIAERFHILLIGEGYTADALDTFHSHATHAAGGNDVDAWIDEVFSIEPYSLFPEAFVIWYLARPSESDIRSGGNTAFQVPVTAQSNSFAQMGQVSSNGATAQLVWEAVAAHPYPPTDFSGGGLGSVRNFVAAVLIYDPDYGGASVSGLTTGLSNPDNSRERLPTAFAMGHAHEFTHAFSGLGDEYMETSSGAPRNTSDTYNIATSNSCSSVPWSHLLVGGAINADTDNLVGAFGDDSLGYHSELLCLLNGTHDNGEFFSSAGSSCSASSCTLRVESRMCNFCREMTAYRIFEHTGLLGNDSAGFEQWVSNYRAAFYDRYEFQVPGVQFEGGLPQSNDVRNPNNGAEIFQACVP